MMMRLRWAGRLGADLFTYTFRSGRWWLPLLVVSLAVAATVVTVAKVVVPTIVYTLF